MEDYVWIVSIPLFPLGVSLRWRLLRGKGYWGYEFKTALDPGRIQSSLAPTRQAFEKPEASTEDINLFSY